MNSNVREFCKFVFKCRPNFVEDFKHFIGAYGVRDEAGHHVVEAGAQRTLIIAYITPLVRRFVESKGYDTRRAGPDIPNWKKELLPPHAMEFIYASIQKEFFK